MARSQEGPADHVWTKQEERELGIEASRNPIFKAVIEADMILESEGTLDGYTCPVTLARIRRLLGDEGAAIWEAIVAKAVETFKNAKA